MSAGVQSEFARIYVECAGRESFDIIGLATTLKPAGDVAIRATAADGTTKAFTAKARIDTPEELAAYRNGGILPYVLRQLVKL